MLSTRWIQSSSDKLLMYVKFGSFFREIETSAFTCTICNYTATSQSEYCRNSNHLVKKIKVKRKFFECTKCKNRTTSFDRLPKTSCSKCGESSWTRTAMIRERKGPLLESEQLSIRGVEQKFINGNVSSANLNLDFWRVFLEKWLYSNCIRITLTSIVSYSVKKGSVDPNKWKDPSLNEWGFSWAMVKLLMVIKTPLRHRCLRGVTKLL